MHYHGFGQFMLTLLFSLQSETDHLSSSKHSCWGSWAAAWFHIQICKATHNPVYFCYYKIRYSKSSLIPTYANLVVPAADLCSTDRTTPFLPTLSYWEGGGLIFFTTNSIKETFLGGSNSKMFTVRRCSKKEKDRRIIQWKPHMRLIRRKEKWSHFWNTAALDMSILN